MINASYPGRCPACHQTFPAGTPLTKKNGRWVHGPECPTGNAGSYGRIATAPVPPPAPPAPQARRLTTDGRIEMPYDKAALELLRSMPGARWNPEDKAWTVSLAVKDRARVLEVADQLDLDVPPSLRIYEVGADVREADLRAATHGLYGFQGPGVRHLALRERAFLADDMGTGKTVQTLVALPTNAAVLVVCPSSLKYNWRREAAKWRPEYKVVVLEGRKSFRLPTAGEMLLVNYDILPAALAGKDPAATLAAQPQAFRDALANVVIVYDEVHMAKNYQAARSQKVATLSKGAKRVWALSGTPMMNKPSDLWGVLSATGMAHEAFGSWAKFMKLFNASKGRYGIEWGEPTAEVAERLRRVMLRRTKAEVLADLPAKTRTLHEVPLTGPLAEEMDAMDEEGCYVDNDTLPPFEMFSAIRAKLAASRIDALTEMVESYEENETPLLVFSAHRAPIEAMGKREGWGVIMGGESSEARDATVAAFQAGQLKGVALTITAGGVGLTLTRASTAIFVDLDWSPALNVQAEDRMHRIGQVNAVECVQLVSDHPLDLHVHALLNEKIRLFERSIDSRIGYKAPKRRSAADIAAEQAAYEAAIAAAEQAQKDADRAAASARVGGWKDRERAKADASKAPAADVLTPARAEAVRGAFEYLFSMCDGAVTKDFVGFNKPDAAIARWVLSVLDTDDGLDVAYSMVRRYFRQTHDQFPLIFKKGA